MRWRPIKKQSKSPPFRKDKSAPEFYFKVPFGTLGTMRHIKTVLLILAVCMAVFLFLMFHSGRTAAPQFISQPVSFQPAEVTADPVSATPAAVCATPAAPVAASVSPAAIPLFTGGEPADVPWTSRTPAALRVRRIFPDAKMMAPEPVLKTGDHIELALFDDAVLDAEISNVTRYPNGAVGLTAHLRNGREGTVFLSYCDGQMSASVQVLGGADFCVRFNPATGAHYAVEVDRKNSVVLEGAEPRIPPAHDAPADAVAPLAVAEPTALADAPAGSTIVDVMIVYTPAALAVEGNVANMNNNITLAMQKANEAHTNSNTQVYLNLVHSAQVTYTEMNYSADLDNLTLTGGANSAMDDVQTWRDQYGADLVCLFENEPGTGGVGWLLTSSSGNPAYAFCLARVQQSDWTYTVVHEWGHNMGCNHSKTQTVQPGTGGGVYTYSAGWQWRDTKAPSPTIGYCSIMTYEDFDAVPGQDYERVAYFSNPSINYIGNSTNATGNASSGDNARTIREMKTVLAGYRTLSSASLLLSGSPMAESGGVAKVTATLSKVHTQPVTVNLAFFGTATPTNDYTSSASSLTIPAGRTTNAITLTAVQDTIYEGPETITVSISSVVNATTGGAAQVTATITDDDPKPDDLRVTPSADAGFVIPVGGVLSPSNQVYVLTNAGTNAINWRATRTGTWVLLSATNGTLAAGSATNVIISVNTNALAESSYYDTVTFTNTTSGIGKMTRQVRLTVAPPYIYFFPLETDPGWARSGEWAFGCPTGQGGTSGSMTTGLADPSGGATDTNVFGVNLNGNYSTATAGPYYLTAGPFNFSGYTNVILHFQRWLNTDVGVLVSATIDVSSNGTSWTSIYTNDSYVEIISTNWNRQTNYISSVADRQATVYVRWGYGTSPGTAYASSGWNIDDIGFLATPVSADADSDGLPDSWEIQYFGGTTNANPTAFASNGINTVSEAYIAGLNPTSAASFFEVNTSEMPSVSNGGFVVRWTAASGRVYSVLSATNLLSGFQPLGTNIVWPQASYTDTVHAAEFRSFYKVKVQLAP